MSSDAEREASQIRPAFAAIEKALRDGYTDIKLTIGEYTNHYAGGTTRELRVQLEIERVFEVKE